LRGHGENNNSTKLNVTSEDGADDDGDNDNALEEVKVMMMMRYA
jgi:hypothetical protein